ASPPPRYGHPAAPAGEGHHGRDCGFYMKYVFLFTSLIQFLIILGLVLFMVYGNAHAGTDTHLRLLEEQMQDRYNKIITLSGRNANLTRTLNNTLKEKQGLQGTLQKVQRELDKCNSSQLPNATPKVRAGMGWGGEPHLTPPPRGMDEGVRAEKAQLRSQLDKTALARKELEDNCAKASAALAKTNQEREGCQQELLSTQTLCESTKSHLELLKRECNILRPDISISLQRIRETISPYSCNSVHEELRRLTQRTEGLFLQQQERDTMYREKSACDVNLLQCRFNCSREKQELEKRLQEADKQLKGGQEEKKKLLAEKEQLSKEVGEKSKAAVQANYLKQRLSICEGAKVRGQLGHGDSPGCLPRPLRESARLGTRSLLLHRHFSALHFYPWVFGPALSHSHFCMCIFFFQPGIFTPAFSDLHFCPCTFARALLRTLFSLAFLPEFSDLRFCPVLRRTPGRDKPRCHPWTLLPRGAVSTRWPCRARHRSRGVGQGPESQHRRAHRALCSWTPSTSRARGCRGPWGAACGRGPSPAPAPTQIL
uniref:Plasmalemma vesicle associated protein n=1 Tax=Anser cygnoides TaxID=8845 RepID=A0A8B9ESK3_ANSCY